jgi:hypothetical protein
VDRRWGGTAVAIAARRRAVAERTLGVVSPATHRLVAHESAEVALPRDDVDGAWLDIAFDDFVHVDVRVGRGITRPCFERRWRWRGVEDAGIGQGRSDEGLATAVGASGSRDRESARGR